MAERLHRTGIVTVAMVATIVLSAVPAGAEGSSAAAHPANAAATSAATTSSHIPVWAADFMAGVVTVTRERAVRQARHFDMIVALKGTYAKYVDAMRAANPDLTLLVYLNGVMAQANEGSKYPDSWYRDRRPGQPREVARLRQLPDEAQPPGMGRGRRRSLHVLLEGERLRRLLPGRAWAPPRSTPGT